MTECVASALSLLYNAEPEISKALIFKYRKTVSFSPEYPKKPQNSSRKNQGRNRHGACRKRRLKKLHKSAKLNVPERTALQNTKTGRKENYEKTPCIASLPRDGPFSGGMRSQRNHHRRDSRAAGCGTRRDRIRQFRQLRRAAAGSFRRTAHADHRPCAESQYC